jgi:putative ubiquitin-RnfH superfamily antitoxin RatB of RatAB toxin-antitoxin module
MGNIGQTVTVKVGVFPGKVTEYAVEVGTTVADVLAMAGLEQSAEQDIKVNDEVVNYSFKVQPDTEVIVLAKRIKGACGERRK